MTKTLFSVVLAALLLLPVTPFAAQPSADQPAVAKEKPGLTIARGVVARSVEKRDAVGVAETFPPDVGNVVFFTEIKNNPQPTTITHVWSYKGKVMAEVSLKVEGSTWRTWSQKRILPEWTGEWKVEAKSADGAVLAAKDFTVK